LRDWPDRPGNAVSFAQFLSHSANILHCDQHEDNKAGKFFIELGTKMVIFD